MPQLSLTYRSGTKVIMEHCDTCSAPQIARGSVYRLQHFLGVIRDFKETPTDFASQFLEMNQDEKITLHGLICGAALCALCPLRPDKIAIERSNGQLEEEFVTPAYQV